MAEVNRSQRQRLVVLMQRDRDGALLSGDRAEMQALQQLAGVNPDAPMRLVRQWADGGGWDTMGTPQRSMTARQKQLQTLRMRWSTRPLSGRQAVCELWRIRSEWDLTPKQVALQRMRQR